MCYLLSGVLCGWLWGNIAILLLAETMRRALFERPCGDGKNIKFILVLLINKDL
jgi:hypothetical protein